MTRGLSPPACEIHLGVAPARPTDGDTRGTGCGIRLGVAPARPHPYEGCPAFTLTPARVLAPPHSKDEPTLVFVSPARPSALRSRPALVLARPAAPSHGGGFDLPPGIFQGSPQDDLDLGVHRTQLVGRPFGKSLMDGRIEPEQDLLALTLLSHGPHPRIAPEPQPPKAATS